MWYISTDSRPWDWLSGDASVSLKNDILPQNEKKKEFLKIDKPQEATVVARLPYLLAIVSTMSIPRTISTIIVAERWVTVCNTTHLMDRNVAVTPCPVGRHISESFASHMVHIIMKLAHRWVWSSK